MGLHFTIVPMFLAIALVLVEICVTKDLEGCKTKLFECLLYLPFFQWIQTYDFYKEISLAAQEKKSVEEFAHKMNLWIDKFKEFKDGLDWLDGNKTGLNISQPKSVTNLHQRRSLSLDRRSLRRNFQRHRKVRTQSLLQA